MKFYSETDLKNFERGRQSLACLCAAILHPLWGYGLHLLVPSASDPLWIRLLFSLTFFMTSFLIKKYKYHKEIFVSLMYVMMIHIFWVTYNSGNHYYYLSGALMAFMGTGYLLDTGKAVAKWYLALSFPIFIFNYFLYLKSENNLDLSILIFLYTSSMLIVLVGVWDRVKLLQNLKQQIKSNHLLSLDLVKQNRKIIASAMAVTLGHEINNPLAIACGTVQIIEKRGVTEKKIKTLKTALSRITEIVSKIQELDVEDIELNEYIEGTEKMMIKLDVKND